MQSSTAFAAPPPAPPSIPSSSSTSARYSSSIGIGAPSSAGPSTQPRDSRIPSSASSHVPSLQQQLFKGTSIPTPSAGILDRSLNRTKGAEVALNAFAFMLSEIVSYSQTRSDSVLDLEKRLSSLGYEAGTRILSLILLRNTQAAGVKDPKREHRLIPILQFVHTHVYKFCFGKAADGLEKSVEGEDEYMLSMNQPPLTQHISIPKDMSQLSCEAFTAGIVEGVLDGLDVPARVTAHTVPNDQYPQRTVILIKLDRRVMDREEVLGK
ncbi:ER to Golgi transport-related protein [Kockovaella imperatae]|uniref:Trafficking protein particle complex subunit n=1 Tax=Kockovaella imperatae TaxID=4999 RepID=A0A1Y1UP53_9TREE|nr:ER to Golgi transport-related protein [Kockovaella imperatae]ORX39782.1 ER to Golgi transport-related protein [Kockovaella imperatae]